jgi:hypothetical protein
MDKRQSKCFHNGIILIVICFQGQIYKLFLEISEKINTFLYNYLFIFKSEK